MITFVRRRSRKIWRTWTKGWVSAAVFAAVIDVIGNKISLNICPGRRIVYISLDFHVEFVDSRSHQKKKNFSQPGQSVGQNVPQSWSVQDCRLIVFWFLTKHRPFGRQLSSGVQHELYSGVEQGRLDLSTSPLGKKHSVDVLKERGGEKSAYAIKYRRRKKAVKSMLTVSSWLKKPKPE